jgi:uncharacterized protein (TIGR03067 family)
MKALLAGLLLALPALVSVSAGGEKGKPTIEGQWSPTGFIGDGKEVKVPDEALAKAYAVFKNGEFTTWFGDKKIVSYRYKIDTSKKPATIDMTSLGKAQLGIFKIEGDKLTLVLGQWNITDMGEALANKNPRPKTFAGKKGVEIHFFKRKK